MSKIHWVEPEFVAEATKGKVFYEIELPEYAEPVLVNYKRLNLLRRLAGASIVEIGGEDGSTSSVSHSIIGMSDDGSALAGKRRATHAKAGSGKSHFRPKGFIAGAIGVPAEVTVNMAELADRVTSSRGQLRSAKEWSRHLNHGISEGFIELSDKNHLTDQILQRSFLSTLYLYQEVIDVMQGDFHSAAIGLGVVATWSLVFGAAAKTVAARHGIGDLISVQPSPFMTFRIERALATRAIADFVKTVKPKEQT